MGDDEGTPMTGDEIVAALCAPDDGRSAVLTGWVCIARFARPDDQTTIVNTSSEDMDAITHLGLVEALRLSAHERFGDSK